MTKKIRFMVGTILLMVIMTYNSCGIVPEPVRPEGTTVGNPFTNLTIAPFEPQDTAEEMSLCPVRLILRGIDSQLIEIAFSNLEERVVTSSGIDLDTIFVPPGRYSGLSVELSNSCGTGRSLSVVNRNGTYSAAQMLSLNFEGEMVFQKSPKKISLFIQPIAKSLNTVASNEQVAPQVSQVTGAVAASGVWSPISVIGAPSARHHFGAALWTGSEMLIWGGYDDYNLLGNGARYNPSTDSWSAISNLNAPSARMAHVTAWTGQEMIVWGGTIDNANFLNTGARYNPTSDTWTAISTAGAPSARMNPHVAWTGSRLIVWGGYDGISSFDGGVTNTGALYDPASNTWSAMSLVNAPSPRDQAFTVWTGDRFIVWGGRGNGQTHLGAMYDPTSNTWTSISSANAPSNRDRIDGTAVWTGQEMIVWGGFNGSNLFNNGARYNPASDTWTPMSTVHAPTPRKWATKVWTGTHFLVWGGKVSSSAYANDGALYDPVTDSWAPITRVNAPAARSAPGVWTGFELLIWGGSAGSTYFGSGARFVP